MIRILITNQKGGVGKSTIAANLAHYFAAWRGKRTVLLDFDTQASSSRWVKAVGLGQGDNPVNVRNILLPQQQGFTRVLIELRRQMRLLAPEHDIVIADLTWNHGLDSEFMFEFDLVVMPSAMSEVELITTIEFAEKHQWVFESARYRPTLVLAPSRVRVDQVKAVHRSSQRFPFSFVLTPPLLDSVDAKRAFAERFLLHHRNLKLSESFLAFCRAIEQTIGIHLARGSRPEIFDPAKTGLPSLHSGLKRKVEAEKAIRNAPATKTIIQVGRPAVVPMPGVAQQPDSTPEPAVANGARRSRPSLSLVSKLFSRED